MFVWGFTFYTRNFYSYGPVTLTPIAERLAVDPSLSLPFLWLRYVAAGIRTSTFRIRGERFHRLRHLRDAYWCTYAYMYIVCKIRLLSQSIWHINTTFNHLNGSQFKYIYHVFLGSCTDRFMYTVQIDTPSETVTVLSFKLPGLEWIIEFFDTWTGFMPKFHTHVTEIFWL